MGVNMSVENEIGVVDFDASTAAWLEQYKNAVAKIKELQEVAEVARAHIEAALGDNQMGMFLNRPVVRWSFVESTRFDTKRAREILPAQVIEALEVKSTSRRFSIVNEDDY
jgi:predicted phage-related endonuclease